MYYKIFLFLFLLSSCVNNDSSNSNNTDSGEIVNNKPIDSAKHNSNLIDSLPNLIDSLPNLNQDLFKEFNEIRKIYSYYYNYINLEIFETTNLNYDNNPKLEAKPYIENIKILLEYADTIDINLFVDKKGFSMMEYSKYYNIEELTNLLSKYISSSETKSTKRIFSVKEINNSYAKVELLRNWSILSPDYIEFVDSLPKPYWKESYIGTYYFKFPSHQESTISWKDDTILKILESKGEKNRINIISVWKKEDEENLRFISLLDKTAMLFYSKLSLENIFEIKETNRTILIGRVSGGEGGDSWETIWIGSLENPNKLNIIFKETCDRNNESLKYKYLKKEQILELEKKRYQFRIESNGKANIIDSSLTIKNINIYELLQE